MSEKSLRQTTIRIDPELLRKARYYLDKERLSVNDFVARTLERYVAQHETPPPQPKRPTPR